MNRNIAIALVLAAAAGTSFADDITVDTTPFASTATRAEVQAELQGFKQSGVNPWSNRYNPLAQFSSQRTRAAVTAEYIQCPRPRRRVHRRRQRLGLPGRARQ